MMWAEIPAIAPGRLGCASASALPRDAPALASSFLSEARDGRRRQGDHRRRRANYVLHGER